MICSKKQILYALLAFVLGLSSNWIGGKTMKIYDVNKSLFYKDISIALFVVGTLAIAYGILSIILRNNPHFCALTQF